MNNDHAKDRLCARIEGMEQERDALAEKARTLIGEWRNGQFGDTAAQAESWRESAAQHARNEDFYRGIVRQIGELFGEEARTSDDGSVNDDVLVLKVPELVEALAAHVERLREGLHQALIHWGAHCTDEDGTAYAECEKRCDEASTTSLTHLKAQWQAEAVVEFGFRYGPETEVRADSQRVANKIRQCDEEVRHENHNS